MYKDTKEAVKIIEAMNWSIHKKKSVIGQIKALHGEKLAEYVRRVAND